MLPQSVLNHYDLETLLLETHMKISVNPITCNNITSVRLGISNIYPSNLAEQLSDDDLNVKCNSTFGDICQYIPCVLKGFKRKFYYIYNLIEPPEEPSSEVEQTQIEKEGPDPDNNEE
eukprot:UN29213